MIKFKLLNERAIMPKRMTTHSAGFDMCAPERVVIPPNHTYWVESGVAMAIPEGYVGLLWPRSGLAYKHGIDTLGGVIDADYRGEVKIGLVNHGQSPVEIAAGERVCQLIVQQFLIDAVLVDDLPLVDTNRTGGFGSTGRTALESRECQAVRSVPERKAVARTQEDVQYSWAERSGQDAKTTSN